MARDGFTENILGVQNLIESPINKVPFGIGEEEEGATSERIDVLDLPKSDEDLLKLRDDWEKLYAPYEGKISEIFKRNLKSYLGRKGGDVLDADSPGPANLQFEAEETFLPAALARNPDPNVYADNTPEGNTISDSVKTMLQFHADQQLLKRKLGVMTRQWSIKHLGVLKHGWNDEINDICTENRKIQDFIFDPHGYVDVFGHFTSWMGERIQVTAEKLAELFPKSKADIALEVISPNGEVAWGTEVTYTEWWTDEYCFSTFKKIVLDKHKNEFWNYDEEGVESDLEETGLVKPKHKNHFAKPLKPYTFLSVFSLQEQPHDITGLIEQNIPNQNKITRRVEQIDTLASQMVNGLTFSEGNFNQETAKQAAEALSDPKKGKILIPQGQNGVNEAIGRIPAGDIPDAAFKDMEVSENHLRSSWGVQGIASQEPKPDETARGMILNQGRDTSRIGGGISDIIEQSVARDVFNWWVQLYMVFYDEKHFASIMGIGKAVQYVTLSGQDIDRQLIVTVSPNSMAPKDETSRMNQAVSLYQAGALGPKVLLETLNFPNSDEAAEDAVLWLVDKASYVQLNFPDLAAKLQQISQQNAQAQAQAQQQELQNQQAQQGQELQAKEQVHQQKLRHSEEGHTQKIQQSREMASAKIGALKQAVPK